MKKGRHRRYEEARKFQRATAESFTVEDYDFDNYDRFGVDGSEDGDFEAAPDDQYGHLAEKYDDYLDRVDLETEHAEHAGEALEVDEEVSQRESA